MLENATALNERRRVQRTYRWFVCGLCDDVNDSRGPLRDQNVVRAVMIVGVH